MLNDLIELIEENRGEARRLTDRALLQLYPIETDLRLDLPSGRTVVIPVRKGDRALALQMLDQAESLKEAADRCERAGVRHAAAEPSHRGRDGSPSA